jgi:hypothetical protein
VLAPLAPDPPNRLDPVFAMLPPVVDELLVTAPKRGFEPAVLVFEPKAGAEVVVEVLAPKSEGVEEVLVVVPKENFGGLFWSAIFPRLLCGK